MKAMPRSANSTANACSYIVSRNPGPNSRCTAIAAAIMDAVISESLNTFPAFLLSSDILTDSLRSGFFPTRIMRHGYGRDLFFFDELFRRVFGWQGRGNWFSRTRRKFLLKFFNKTLCRPGTGLAKRADCTAGDVVADGLQGLWVVHNSTAF